MIRHKSVISGGLAAVISLILGIVVAVAVSGATNDAGFGVIIGILAFFALLFLIYFVLNTYLAVWTERDHKANFYKECAIANIDVFNDETLAKATEIADKVYLSKKAQKKMAKCYKQGKKYTYSKSPEEIRLENQKIIEEKEKRLKEIEEQKRKEKEEKLRQEQKYQLLAGSMTSEERNAYIAKVNDMLTSSSSSSSASKSSSSKKPASVVKRGVVGGIVAGPAGAVVGALSAVDKNNRTQNKK